MPDEGEVVAMHAALLDLPEEAVAALEQRLSEEERERAARFRFAADRLLFVASHALLHHVLDGALGHAAWRLRAESGGRPLLELPAGAPALQVSLTHTRGLAAMALANGRRVGVDTEALARPEAVALLADRVLAPCEREALAALPAADRPRAFTRYWTLKEALSKALGEGLARPFETLPFRLEPLSLLAPHGTHGRWHMEELQPTAEHQIALAVSRGVEPPVIRWRRLDVQALRGG
jgi:4'-phosphopantetheinyl transferase